MFSLSKPATDDFDASRPVSTLATVTLFSVIGLVCLLLSRAMGLISPPACSGELPAFSGKNN